MLNGALMATQKATRRLITSIGLILKRSADDMAQGQGKSISIYALFMSPHLLSPAISLMSVEHVPPYLNVNVPPPNQSMIQD